MIQIDRIFWTFWMNLVHSFVQCGILPFLLLYFSTTRKYQISSLLFLPSIRVSNPALYICCMYRYFYMTCLSLNYFRHYFFFNNKYRIPPVLEKHHSLEIEKFLFLLVELGTEVLSWSFWILWVQCNSSAVDFSKYQNPHISDTMIMMGSEEIRKYLCLSMHTQTQTYHSDRRGRRGKKSILVTLWLPLLIYTIFGIINFPAIQNKPALQYPGTMKT